MGRIARNIPLAALAGAGLYWAGMTFLRRARKISFANRLVLITGGSRGLGLVLARELGAEGARIILCARDSDELEAAGRDLKERGVEVTVRTCDVTNREAIQSLVGDIVENIGIPDVIINNAGVIAMGPLESQTDDDFQQSMNTHFYAPLWVNDAFLPYLRERGFGRIVNIASIGGLVSIPHLLPYCSSKSALVGYSQGLRNHLAEHGILVTTVCPGLMRTGSPRQALFKGDHRAEYAWFKISGSLPLATIGAEKAARQIVDACRYGEAMAIVGMPANLASRFQALFPNLSAELLSLAHRMLPEPPPNDDLVAYRGYESTSATSETWLTALTDEAALRNNEMRSHSEARS